MADTNKPLSRLTAAEQKIEPVPFMTEDDPPPPIEFDEPEAPAESRQSTHERLRAFEDAHFGEDHLRHAGKIERGKGSAFQTDREDGTWGPQHRAHHAALEALIEAEAEHQKAGQIEAAAHAKLDAAIRRAGETEERL